MCFLSSCCSYKSNKLLFSCVRLLKTWLEKSRRRFFFLFLSLPFLSYISWLSTRHKIHSKFHVTSLIYRKKSFLKSYANFILYSTFALWRESQNCFYDKQNKRLLRERRKQKKSQLKKTANNSSLFLYADFKWSFSWGCVFFSFVQCFLAFQLWIYLYSGAERKRSGNIF
jgi:hypothetical protein